MEAHSCKSLGTLCTYAPENNSVFSSNLGNLRYLL